MWLCRDANVHCFNNDTCSARAGRKHVLRAAILATGAASVCTAAYWGWLERARSVEIRREHVVQRVESIIRGSATDFASHIDEPGIDPVTAFDALRPWLGSSNEKLRIRSRLLNVSLHHAHFESLVIDWDKIENELSPQVVRLADTCKDAV